MTKSIDFFVVLCFNYMNLCLIVPSYAGGLERREDMPKKQELERISDNLNLIERMLAVFKNAWKNLRNKNVPGGMKFIYILYLTLEVAYIISPIDILPDWLLPFLGFADDMAMLPLILHTLNRFNKRSGGYLQLPPKPIKELPPFDPPSSEEALDE